MLVGDAALGAILDFEVSYGVQSLGRDTAGKSLQGVKVKENESVGGVHQIECFLIYLSTAEEKSNPVYRRSRVWKRGMEYGGLEVSLRHGDVVCRVWNCNDFPRNGDNAKAIVTDDVRVNS